MSDIFEQFVQLDAPELTRVFIDSLYIGLLVLTVLLLMLTITSRRQQEKNKHENEKKEWVKIKADHYERFSQITDEFEKLIFDFEYLTRNIRSEKPDTIESLMLLQFKDKLDELTKIVDAVKNSQFPNDRELFNQNFSSTMRYISHVEKVTKITREYIDTHFEFEESIRDQAYLK